MDLLNYTFKKREKFDILWDWFHDKDFRSLLCLDLGCAKGIMSAAIRKLGGTWISADLDWSNVSSTRSLVSNNVIQIHEYNLPFKNASFDKVVLLDFLEHILDDTKCLQEIHRIIKTDGIFIVSTPKTGASLFLNKIKPLFGLTLDKYGHVREGYTEQQLAVLLEKSGFSVLCVKNYSHLLTESIEMILNSIYVKINKNEIDKRDGYISPASQDDYEKHSTAFKLYKIAYPFLWWLSRLDCILKIAGAYAIMIKAKKMV